MAGRPFVFSDVCLCRVGGTRRQVCPTPAILTPDPGSGVTLPAEEVPPLMVPANAPSKPPPTTCAARTPTPADPPNRYPAGVNPEPSFADQNARNPAHR